MVYDSAAQCLFLFVGGGPNATNGTWTFADGSWTDLSVSVEPPSATSMAYDPNLRAVVAYVGGLPQGNYTWQFHGGAWWNVTPSESPVAQIDVTLSYNPLSQSVLLFGGLGSADQYLGQTWSYNGSNWTRLNPSDSPSPRIGASMTFDARDGLTLLVGGTASDSWAFGAGVVGFVSSPGVGGSTRMGSSLHANGTATWFPFGDTYSLRAVPNPGYSGREVNVTGNLVLFNGTYVLFGNATVESSFVALPTVTILSLPSSCELDFNGTQYTNGSAAPFVAGRTFSLSAPTCGTVVFGVWSGSGNASITNPSNSSTTVTLTGPATITGHFSANLQFYVEPAGVGAVLVNGSRVGTAGPSLTPVGSYPILALPAPGWRLSHYTVSGTGVSIANGILTVESSGWVLANFSAYPTVVVGTTVPTCGPVTWNGTTEMNGSLVATDLGTFPATAPSCDDALFERWQTSGNVSVSAPSRTNTTVTVTGNGTLEAVLGRAAWITIWVQPEAAAGSVEWNSTHLENGSRTEELLGRYPIQGVAVAGWQFYGWETIGGVNVSSAVAALASNGTLVAVFENTSGTTPTQGEGGAGLTVAEWAGLAIGLAAAAVLAAIWMRRRGQRPPAHAPPGGQVDGTGSSDLAVGEELESGLT
jgi:hypothetical protein